MGKQSSSSTTRTIYGITSTTNPYAYARTDNSGTVAGFQDGTALNSVYNFVNKNIESLLDEYLNPNINSSTNQAKLNAFRSNLNSEAYRNLENNIINPLSKRNMIRSSQATDLYRNLSDTTTSSIANYINSLIADSQNNSANVINNLLKAYMQGYQVISDMQGQSLRTSQGNATKTTSTSSGSNTISGGGLFNDGGSTNLAENSSSSSSSDVDLEKMAQAAAMVVSMMLA